MLHVIYREKWHLRLIDYTLFIGNICLIDWQDAQLEKRDYLLS